MGEQAEQLQQLSFSYQSAKQTLKIAKTMGPHRYFYDYRDFAIPVLLSKVRQPDQEVHVKKIWERLSQADSKGDLAKTLLCYINANGEIAEVSSRLFIHRNTLHYRLKKSKRRPDAIQNIWKTCLSCIQRLPFFHLFVQMNNFNVGYSDEIRISEQFSLRQKAFTIGRKGGVAEMDIQIHAIGALCALAISIFLILKKVP